MPSWSTLTARSRPSLARFEREARTLAALNHYTSPSPPVPIWTVISYEPIRVPRAIATAAYSSFRYGESRTDHFVTGEPGCDRDFGARLCA